MKRFILAVIALAIPIISGAQSREELYALCDSLSMETPVIRPFTKADKAKYSVKNLDYGMTIGIERKKCGELYMAKFTEQDILSRTIVSRKGFLRRMIYKAGRSET